jgi:L-ascorbate metabolism protein UlaG (beta-lactamase superfamily)
MSIYIKILLIIIIIIILFVIAVYAFRATPQFGRTPCGEILARIEASPNYRDDRFHNHTPRVPRPSGALSRFAQKVEDLRPSAPLPSVKTDLMSIKREENVLVWLGHSALFIQLDGIRFLIDPALVNGSPVPFINRPFPGSDIFSPDDIPEIDYLLINHDHFYHLDYQSIISLREKIGKVVCGLGLGEHFRRWDFPLDDIIELDWNEFMELNGGIIVHALPARHYSGRASFGVDNVLWVSFMIEAPSATIYISGDTGYGTHFAEIGKQFPAIDLAIVEFGQYGYDWSDIHIMPDEISKALLDLNARRSFTTHHAKYTLARHPWYEPLNIVAGLNEQEGYEIITPMMGEVVRLGGSTQEFSKWWEAYK